MTKQVVTDEPLTDVELARRQSNRNIMILMFGIPCLVIAISTVMYFMAENKLLNLGTANKGQLITPPVQLMDIALNDSHSKPLAYDQPEPRWTFLIVGNSQCLEACEKMLYLSRQTMTALGENIVKVRRFYLNTDAAMSDSLTQLIAQEHKNLSVVYGDSAEFQNLLAGSGVDTQPANQIYLVDPRGWVMMSYQAKSLEADVLNQLGKDMLRDMKRLFK